MSHSIAITGAGIICSIGTDKSSVLNSLKENKSGIETIRYLDSKQKLPVGEVKMTNDELKAMLGIKHNLDISRTSLLGAVALRQAMQESKIDPKSLSGKKIVLISGTTVGGMDVTERHYPAMLTDNNEAAYVVQHDCGNNTKEIAALCGLDCEVITISTACSSALNAIILGCRMLLSREVDVVIAGGTEALSKFHLNGFNSLMILDSERCRPFDASRRGLNLGEGAAYVVIERGNDANKREAPILGYVAGYGNRCDAFHQTATSENGEGAYLAMKDAIHMSGISLDDIDYINAHGTGTPDNDRSESAAVRCLFGEDLPLMSSTKSFTGHTTSASGSIETVICLLAIQQGFVPANLGWEESTQECITPTKGLSTKTLHNVLCNSFGFGGNDSSIVLSDIERHLPDIKKETIEVVSSYEVNDADDLKDLRKYVSPMESRRMSQVMKASLLTSMKALEDAEIEKPDAIIIGTQYGMLDQGEKILEHLLQSGEDGISPTLFMQSTHNTIAGSLAIRFNCHGYNITYSQGEDSLDLALKDAERLISEHKADTVLIGVHDQCPDKFRDFFVRAGLKQPVQIRSKSMIIKRVE